MKTWLLTVIAVSLLAGTAYADDGLVSSIWRSVTFAKRIVNQAFYRGQGRILGACLRIGMSHDETMRVTGNLFIGPGGEVATGASLGRAITGGRVTQCIMKSYRLGLHLVEEEDANRVLTLRKIAYLPFFGD
jgi:hypothetical protein